MHAVASQRFPCGISGCRGGTEVHAHVCMSFVLVPGRGELPRAAFAGSLTPSILGRLLPPASMLSVWFVKPGGRIYQFFGYSP